MKRIMILVLLVALLLMANASWAMSSPNFRLEWYTPMDGGGGGSASSANYAVNFTVGQTAIHASASGKRLNEIEGISCTKPEGAFYAFPKIHDAGSLWETDLEFVVDLLKATGVLLVNGSGFDSVYGGGHARLVFLPPIETLEQAFDALEEFMKKKKKGST